MKLLLLFLLALVPGITFADVPTIFTPSAGDLSVMYLSNIFGMVDGVLHGTGSQVLGTMFGIFNSALLSMAGLVIMYVLVVSTLNTAHEGEVMGKTWSEIWLPLRMVVGIGAMLPKASGYSFIQVFVMWIVVQGVGAADHVWVGALSYLSRGGILVQQNQALATSPASQVVGAGANPQLIFVAGNILKAETCMYVLRNSLIRNAGSKGGQVPDFTSTLLVQGIPSGKTPPCYDGDIRPGCPAGNDTGGRIYFPGNVLGLQGVCGSVDWAFSPAQQQEVEYKQGGDYVKHFLGDLGPGTPSSRSIAVQQLVLDVQPTAYALAQSILPSSPAQPIPPKLTLNDFLSRTSQLVNSATDYMSIMGPYLNTAGQKAAQAQLTAFARAAQDGWILAGSYYFMMSSLNNAFIASEAKGDQPKVTFNPNYDGGAFGPNTGPTAVVLKANIPPGAVSSCSSNAQPFDAYICAEFTNPAVTTGQSSSVIQPATQGGGGPRGDYSGDWAAAAINAPVNATGSAASAVAGAFGKDWGGWSADISGLGVGKVETYVINTLPDKFNDLMNNLNKMLTAQNQANADPIVLISAMGANILDMIEYIWITGAIGIFLISMVASICQASNPFGNAINSFLMWFIPMLTGVMFTMFVIGATMTYYIPMIPLIVFLFAAIGWFVAVIESMLAAPFVALGITVPGGHEHFGHGQNAIMLLLNLFMRPTLIIFGFIAASILVHVALWLLNQGLGTAMTIGGMSTGMSQDSSHILTTVAILMVYVTVVLSIVERCFNLIHELPQHVMTWIGGNMRSLGEAEGAAGVQKGFGEKMQVVGGAMEKAGGAEGMQKAGHMTPWGKPPEGGAKKPPPGGSEASGSGGGGAPPVA